MKEGNEEKKARLKERKRLKPSVGEFLKKLVEEQISEGKTQITFDELTEGCWSEEPLAGFVKTFAGNKAKPCAQMEAGMLLYHQMQEDERFTLSYYPKPKKEDKRGKARLYIVKAQSTQSEE